MNKKLLIIVILVGIIILPVLCLAQDMQNETSNIVNIERIVRLFRFYGLILILLVVVIITLCIAVIRLSHHRKKPKTEDKKVVKSKEKEASQDDKMSPGKRDILKTISKTEEEIILELLNNNGRLTQNDLHANTGIPRSTLSRTLKSLEQKKLVEVRCVGVTNLVKLQEWFMEK